MANLASIALDRRRLLAGAAAAGLAGCASRGNEALVPTPAARSDALGDSDGVGVSARVRAGDVTPAEVLEAAIARAEAVNPTLNFFTARTYDAARARAARTLSGPLSGVPTLIKDNRAQGGAPLTYGSRAFANNVAPANHIYVQALEDAGLVSIGKSTLPEFGFTATTEPLLNGPTRNPWNPDHSTGGSSGGSAAAVAAGVIPLAHANDGGGSVRIPASCCGLVGLKVSRGRQVRVPGREGPPVDISVDGCVSRTVRDTAAWFAVTEASGPQAPLPPVGLVSGPSERRLRIGYFIPDGLGREPDPAVRSSLENVIRICADLGHRIEETPLPLDGAAFAEAFTLYWAAGAAQTVADVQAAANGQPLDQLLEPLTLQLADLWARQPEGAMEGVVRTLRTSAAQANGMFSSIDVFLTPVLASPPPQIGTLAPTLPFEEGFARVQAYASYTPLQNASGAPAIFLPLGQSPDGLPIGAQFSAQVGAERTLLELAYELELASPWAGRRPPIWTGPR